jgi:hypothetical protein
MDAFRIAVMAQVYHTLWLPRFGYETLAGTVLHYVLDLVERKLLEVALMAALTSRCNAFVYCGLKKSIISQLHQGKLGLVPVLATVAPLPVNTLGAVFCLADVCVVP